MLLQTVQICFYQNLTMTDPKFKRWIVAVLTLVSLYVMFV